MRHLECQVREAFKSVARNGQVKSYIQQSNELYPLFLKAAKRYITGEYREEGIKAAEELLSSGYKISLEYIGENMTNKKECEQAKDEFLNLINELGAMSSEQTVSLDLSHIGLSVNPEIAYVHMQELAQKAKEFGITLMISMEESSKTDDILTIYKKVTKEYSNVGITIQAHLNRSKEDIRELIHYPGKIRLVKGAYQEVAGISIPRSSELNERYLNIMEQLIEANHPVSIATHDEILLQEMEHREYLSRSHVGIEMLYGVRPDLLKEFKNKGHHCSVYLLYGKEWYLYVCHRIAECPENLYRLVIDIVNPTLSEERCSFY